MSKRKGYIDLVRIIACFFVICIHTAVADEYTRVPAATSKYNIYLFVSILTRCAVPMFFMISGATLLDKKESIKDVWKKRVFKILVLLVGFSLFYYMCDVMIGKESFDLIRFFTVLLGKGWVMVFWYLYAYIGFLIILPLLRVLVQNLNRSIFTYLVVICFIFELVLPLMQGINQSLSINDNLSIGGFTSMIIMYPCMGYYIEKHCLWKRKLGLIPLWAANIWLILMVCNETAQSHSTGLNSGYGLMLNAFTIYITVKLLYGDKSSHLNSFITSLGSCTLGIYLFHPMLLERIKFLNRLKNLVEAKMAWMDALLFDFIFVAWIMLLGYVITWILKKIPIVRTFF